MVGAILVGEPPPAVQLPKYHVLPATASQVFHRYQLPGRGQQLAAIGQRLAKVPGGVQHVHCNDQVISMQVETLVAGIPLNVQGAVFQRGSRIGEPVLGLGKEPRRNIGEHIREIPGPQLGQDHRSAGAGSRAHLQNPQGTPLRPVGHGSRNGFAQQPVRCAGCRGGEVIIGYPWPLSGEQNGQGVYVSLQHRGQRSAASPQQTQFDGAMGVEGSQPVVKVIRVGHIFVGQGFSSPDSDPVFAAIPLQHSGVGQQAQHSVEKDCMFGEYAQLFPQ